MIVDGPVDAWSTPHRFRTTARRWGSTRRGRGRRKGSRECGDKSDAPGDHRPRPPPVEEYGLLSVFRPHRRLPRDGQGGAHRLRAPFALTGMFLGAAGVARAARATPRPYRLFTSSSRWSGAHRPHGFNRLVTRRSTRRNPGRGDRAIPSGQVSRPMARVFILMVRRRCSPRAFQLTPVLLLLLFSYSYMKRFHGGRRTSSSRLPGAGRWRRGSSDGRDARVLWLCLAVLSRTYAAGHRLRPP